MTTMALNRHAERVFNPERKDTHWETRFSCNSVLSTLALAFQLRNYLIRKAGVGSDGSERP